jgi:hypothetical protein
MDLSNHSGTGFNSGSDYPAHRESIQPDEPAQSIKFLKRAVLS